MAAALGLLTGVGSTAVAAGDAAPPAGTAPGLIVTVGGYALYEPDFEGASEYVFGFRPVFNIRREGARVWLDIPDDGLDYELFETSNFRAGIVGNFRYSRDINTLDRGFKKVGSVELSLEAGAFAEYWPADWLRTRVEVRAAVIGARGVVADFGADLVSRPNDRLIVTVGPRMSLADQDFMNEYYGVTPQQSANTGIARYNANAGFRSVGVTTSSQYKLTENLTGIAFAEYIRLVGAAGDSTLIDARGSADQFHFGLGMKYSFHVDW